MNPQTDRPNLKDVCVCAGTGVVFGWLPARKASRLDPIAALRKE